MARLDNKVAIVTGSAQGIGRQIALALARSGADIVVVDLTKERGESVGKEINEIGTRALTVGCDVTD